MPSASETDGLDDSPSSTRKDTAVTSPLPEFQLRQAVEVVLKRKWLIIGLALAGVLLAALANFSSQKMYSSTATVEVNKQGGASLGITDLGGDNSPLGGSSGMNIDLMTQKAVIESTKVALTVIQSMNLMSVTPYRHSDKRSMSKSKEPPVPVIMLSTEERERVVGIFSSRLKVDLVKDTRLLTVTFTDSDPDRASAIANEVVSAYTHAYSEARYTAATTASSWLASQLDDLKQKVLLGQRKVSEYEQQTGLIGAGPSPTSAAGASASDGVTMNRFIDLNRDLTNAEVARIARESIYRLTDTQDPDVILGVASSELANSAGSGSVIGPSSSDIGLLASLRQQKSQISLRKAAESTKYGSKSPMMASFDSEENEVDRQIKTEIGRIHQRAKSDFELAKATESGLQARINQQQQEVAKLSSGANQLLILQQEETSNRLLYQDLYTKLEEANVAAGIKASNITIVDPALPSSTPSSPKTKRNVIAGLGCGLLLGIFIAFFLDYFTDRITDLEQIAHVTTIPVIGFVPQHITTRQKAKGTSAVEVPEELQSVSWLLSAPNSPSSEAIRSLRSSILLSQARTPPKLIAFTSAMSGDGKSTLCFNSAIAFALAGRKVLLIDADMRRPRMHFMTGCSNTTGLAQYLSSDLPLSQFVQPFQPLDSITVLSCGAIPPLPSELLESSRFVELLQEAQKEYDVILIDTPPLLLVTDALIISTRVDSTIMVLRSDKTTEQMLRRATAQLSNVSASKVRIVLNGVDVRPGSGYYYGKNDYYTKA